MFGYVSKREHEAVVAERDTLRRTVVEQKATIRTLGDNAHFDATAINRLTTALAEARAKQPQRGDKGRFVGVGK